MKWAPTPRWDSLELECPSWTQSWHALLSLLRADMLRKWFYWERRISWHHTNRSCFQKVLEENNLGDLERFWGPNLENWISYFFSLPNSERIYSEIGMLTGSKIVWTLPNKHLQKKKKTNPGIFIEKNWRIWSRWVRKGTWHSVVKSLLHSALGYELFKRCLENFITYGKKSASLKRSQICEQDPNLFFQYTISRVPSYWDKKK